MPRLVELRTTCGRKKAWELTLLADHEDISCWGVVSVEWKQQAGRLLGHRGEAGGSMTVNGSTVHRSSKSENGGGWSGRQEGGRARGSPC